MKVLEQSITYRDTFLAVIECEYCGDVERDVFGKDTYEWWFTNLPKMVCPTCGKRSGDENEREKYEIKG